MNRATVPNLHTPALLFAQPHDCNKRWTQHGPRLEEEARPQIDSTSAVDAAVATTLPRHRRRLTCHLAARNGHVGLLHQGLATLLSVPGEKVVLLRHERRFKGSMVVYSAGHRRPQDAAADNDGRRMAAVWRDSRRRHSVLPLTPMVGPVAVRHLPQNCPRVLWGRQGLPVVAPVESPRRNAC